jgi:phytoene dehydrogenase-like protein
MLLCCCFHLLFTLLPTQAASFLHMHLGIDATDLSPDLDCHHLVVNDWSNLEAPLNVCIASIPTQFDPALAPPGKAVVHAYTAGNEPYSVWEGLRRGSKEYEDMKQQRTQTLWKVRKRKGGREAVVHGSIQQALSRTAYRGRSMPFELYMVGTPLTHAFLLLLLLLLLPLLLLLLPGSGALHPRHQAAH